MTEQLERSHPDPELLARIAGHPLDKPAAEFQFSKRLAQENGWPHGFALRVIKEYRRFVYLACIAEGEVTPSDEVDQAWHLHVAYTRDYWTVFCPQVLHKDLHHGPTDGGGAERNRYEANYVRTLELYERIFGEAPPRDIWPPSSIRFGYASGNVRVNRRLFTIVPKGKPRPPWIAHFGFVIAVVIFTGFVVTQYPLSTPLTQDEALFRVFVYIAIAVAWLWVIVVIVSGVRRTLGRENVIVQPQHGFTVTFTVGIAVGADASNATVTSVEFSGDGSGEGGSGDDGGNGGGDGGGCGGD